MAYTCYKCGKRPAAGKSISHSHKASNRRFLPNLQRVKIAEGRLVKRVMACTSCLRSGRIQKAI